LHKNADSTQKNEQKEKKTASARRQEIHAHA
jgi:hypothetical protein